MKTSYTITLAAILGIALGFAVLPAPDMEGSGGDWQVVPASIQRTADKLELGLRVSARELAAFEEFCEKTNH